jgi:hypothetical protein
MKMPNWHAMGISDSESKEHKDEREWDVKNHLQEMGPAATDVYSHPLYGESR